jgi:hypothetical protein
VSITQTDFLLKIRLVQRIFFEVGKMTIRFADVESLNQREVIDDYLRLPLVSLEEAMVPISLLIPNISQYTINAKLASSVLNNNLTEDESAAIYLYTMDSVFYGKLNSAMRSNKASHVEPYFLYLKLFYTALGKLPCQRELVWGGIRSNVSSTYIKGKFVIWHSASSSSLDGSAVTNFLDKNAQCTLFQIECRHGKSISKHSAFPSESEIILMPGTKLLVKNKPLSFNGFQLVQLEEMPNPNLKKILPVLPLIKRSIINDKQTSKPAKPKVTPRTLNPVSVLPGIKSATTDDLKINNCEYTLPFSYIILCILNYSQ